MNCVYQIHACKNSVNNWPALNDLYSKIKFEHASVIDRSHLTKTCYWNLNTTTFNMYRFQYGTTLNERHSHDWTVHASCVKFNAMFVICNSIKTLKHLFRMLFCYFHAENRSFSLHLCGWSEAPAAVRTLRGTLLVAMTARAKHLQVWLHFTIVDTEAFCTYGRVFCGTHQCCVWRRGPREK